MTIKGVLGALGQTLIVLLALFVASKSIDYLDFKVKGVLIGREKLLLDTLYSTTFYSHVIFASLALVIGPFQFFKRIRTRYRKWHIAVGQVYVVCCFIGATTGFYISFFTFGGFIATLGFIMLSGLWLFTIVKGYRAVMAKNFKAHRIWMTRNYALTFAAVTLRLWIALLTEALDVSFDQAYRIAAWTCWSLNVVLVEIYLRSSNDLKFVFKNKN